jgi:hypothetical protein
MRACLVALLSTQMLLFAFGNDRATADAPKQLGDDIKCFLNRVTCNYAPVSLYAIDRTKPVDVGRTPPPKEALVDPNWPLPLPSVCSHDGRDALKNALCVAPFQSSEDFQPDCCMVLDKPEGVKELLWIDSSASSLQMQLYRSDRASIVDVSSIDASKVPGGDVQNALKAALVMCRRPYDAMLDMVGAINKTPFELYAIDPKQSADIFDKKHWNIVGRVASDKTVTNVVNRALNLAFDNDAMPLYASTHVFLPRLAISARVPVLSTAPSGPRQQYVLLLAFDCRLAELYVDGKLQGCCGINGGWSAPGTIQGPAGSGTGPELKVAADEMLNKIFEDHGQPIKPKSTTTGN